MLDKVNIVVFGVDRCPDLCRPAFEAFLCQLGEEVEIYIGIISLEIDPVLLKNQQLALEAWLERIQLKNPSWHIKACRTYLQNEPSLYGSSLLLDNAVKQCLKRLDIFYNGYASVRNYINYLYFSHCFSRDLFNIVENYPTILLRPDMQYGGVTRTSLADQKRSIILSKRIAYVMGHDSFGYVNDRLLASSTQNVLAYMQRIDYLDSYLRWPWRYFHSERFASWLLRRRMKLQLNELPLTFWGRRVRTGGEILDDSNSMNYELDRKHYQLMFNQHSYWQMKLSLKKRMSFLVRRRGQDQKRP